MEPFHRQPIGQLLGSWPIGDRDEGIVRQLVGDVLPAEFGGQPVMPVEIDLQPAGQPSRDPHVAQPQLFIDEIEVVVQALAIVRPQEGFAGGLVRARVCR